MENISSFLDKIYSYEYFAPIIFGITAFLIVLFFVILFFGKKDEKSKELEKTKQMELASINAFNDTEQPKEVEITEVKENPFEKANEIANVEEEQTFTQKYNFPKIDIEPTQEQPVEEQSFTQKYNFPKTMDGITNDSELKPILDPIKSDDIILSNSEESKEVKEVKDKFSSLATSIDEELSSLENMIKESHDEIEKNNEEQSFTQKYNFPKLSVEDETKIPEEEQSFTQKYNFPKLDVEDETKTPEEEQSFTQKYNFPKFDNDDKPMISKNIPGSKQIFSSVFVAPAKEETPNEYDNDDFKEKFNSLIKDASKPVEIKENKTDLSFTQKYNFPKLDVEDETKTPEEEQSFTQKYNFPKFDEVQESKKESIVKPINFTIKGRTDNKSIDLPKKADVDLPKLNEEDSNERITKEDFPEFPSLTNELESFKR